MLPISPGPTVTERVLGMSLGHVSKEDLVHVQDHQERWQGHSSMQILALYEGYFLILPTIKNRLHYIEFRQELIDSDFSSAFLALVDTALHIDAAYVRLDWDQKRYNDLPYHDQPQPGSALYSAA